MQRYNNGLPPERGFVLDAKVQIKKRERYKELSKIISLPTSFIFAIILRKIEEIIWQDLASI